jgi:hypothetical protein
MKILKNKKYNILSSILKYSFVVVFAVMVAMPTIVFGLDGTGPSEGASSSEGTGPSDGTGINTKILNPLGVNGPQTIPDFIKKLVEIVLYVGIPIIALAIIYTGFLFVQAQGNSEELTKAKKALMYTLIGGALLLGAFVIAQAIGSTVDEIKKGV